MKEKKEASTNKNAVQKCLECDVHVKYKLKSSYLEM